jgi:hypothetical protein
MAKLDLPYIAWRDGRPRFNPGPKQRRLGFAGRDLRHQDGRWYDLAEAHAWARQNLAAIASARKSGGKPGTKPEQPDGPKKTVAQLLADWLASDEVAGLKPATRNGYRKCVDAVLYRPESREDAARRRQKEQAAALLGLSAPERERERFAAAAVSGPEAIGKPELNDFFNYLRKNRGHHMAQAVVAVLSAALTWGATSSAWRLRDNPRLGMRLARPKARVVIYTREEIRHLVATADAQGRASIGDSVMLGIWTGQRQGDRLALEDGGLINGRRVFEQEKRGAIVAIATTPELEERLALARARVAAIKLRMGTRPAAIIVDEKTGGEYNESSYRHAFAEIRSLAAQTLPAISGKRDQDLRDTAVTWLANAGCTLPEIASITGHSLQSIHSILKHYLAITPELADSAIAKYVAWMERSAR